MKLMLSTVFLRAKLLRHREGRYLTEVMTQVRGGAQSEPQVAAKGTCILGPGRDQLFWKNHSNHSSSVSPPSPTATGLWSPPSSWGRVMASALGPLPPIPLTLSPSSFLRPAYSSQAHGSEPDRPRKSSPLPAEENLNSHGASHSGLPVGPAAGVGTHAQAHLSTPLRALPFSPALPITACPQATCPQRPNSNAIPPTKSLFHRR